MTESSVSTQGLERQLLEFAPDAMIGAGPDGRIVWVNARAAELFGYERDELIGEPVEALVPVRYRREHIRHRQRYAQRPWTRPMGEGPDLRARRRDGSEFPCQISLSAVQSEGGAIAVAVVRDLTDRRRARDELRVAVQRLQAAADVAVAVGGETELEAVLGAIVERGRALVDARALVILLLQGDELVVAATSGELDPGVDGLRFPSASGVRELLGGRLGSQRLIEEEGSGPALVSPLLFRGEPLGVVVALDGLGERQTFDEEDGRLLEAFAASAATAVATAQSVAEDRLLNTIQAAENERGRWARELHDETLQGLAALRVRLGAALRQQSPDELERAGQDAIEQIEIEIQKLRTLITELRPAALDEIGLDAAIRALAARSAAQAGFQIDLRLSLNGSRLASPALETTVYRLVQEGLTNVVKHAGAEHVALEVSEREAGLRVVISDDGVGFEPGIRPEGFGIRGMRERVTLAGGQLEIESASGSGTRISAILPASELDPGPGDG